MGEEKFPDQVFDKHIRRAADADKAVFQSCHAADLGSTAFQVQNGLVGIVEKNVAQAVYVDVVALPLKEANAQLVLQLGDGFGQGGLGDMELFGGL
jgi:uncharacterized protein YkvS